MDITVREDRLTDGSKVYALMITTKDGDVVQVDCINQQSAWMLQDVLGNRVTDIKVN